MNVFVLNTGRCGSTTFAKACKHISNFSSSHESRKRMLGNNRLAYPENHIEIDNRLSWLLGRLDRKYGNNAIYIHLKRDTEKTAASFVKRYNRGIIRAYRGKGGIITSRKGAPLSVALDYCDTVNSNIDLFLKDKTMKMEFNLENAKQDFLIFWELIHAEGNIDTCLAEFDVYYNASK